MLRLLLPSSPTTTSAGAVTTASASTVPRSTTPASSTVSTTLRLSGDTRSLLCFAAFFLEPSQKLSLLSDGIFLSLNLFQADMSEIDSQYHSYSRKCLVCSPHWTSCFLQSIFLSILQVLDVCEGLFAGRDCLRLCRH